MSTSWWLKKKSQGIIIVLRIYPLEPGATSVQNFMGICPIVEKLSRSQLTHKVTLPFLELCHEKSP